MSDTQWIETDGATTGVKGFLGDNPNEASIVVAPQEQCDVSDFDDESEGADDFDDFDDEFDDDFEEEMEDEYETLDDEFDDIGITVESDDDDFDDEDDDDEVEVDEGK